MQNSYGAKAYHKTAVETASKEKILLLLYEACIRYLKKAQKAIKENKIEEKGKMIGKAQDIINELTNTLDFKSGGDIAIQLEQLYMFVFDYTTAANIENDVKKIDSCINILQTLYEGWKEAVNQQKPNTKDTSKNIK